MTSATSSSTAIRSSAAGRDATLARRLADRRCLDARSVARHERRSQRIADRLAACRLVCQRRRARRRGPDMNDDTLNAIASRADFRAAVRTAFAQAETRDAAEILIVDPTFNDWPLNEPALDRFARPLGRFAQEPDRLRPRLRRARAPSAALRRVAAPVVARGPLPQRSGTRGRADSDPVAGARRDLRSPARSRQRARYRLAARSRSRRRPRND